MKKDPCVVKYFHCGIPIKQRRKFVIHELRDSRKKQLVLIKNYNDEIARTVELNEELSLVEQCGG